jgi:hypothetical protein
MRSNNAKAYFVMAFGVLMILGLIIGAVLMETEPMGADGCYRDQTKVTNSIQVFLDTSDSYSQTHRMIIGAEIFKRIAGAPEGAHIGMYAFDASGLEGNLTTSVMSLCVPTESVQDSPLFAQLKKKRFVEAINESLSRTYTESDVSPILEALNEVVASRPPYATETELIIATDLMQNSDLFSMYEPNWKQVVHTFKNRIDKSRPSLRGTQIDVLFVTRPLEDRQTFDVRDWWLEFLSASGGDIRQFKLISG